MSLKNRGGFYKFGGYGGPIETHHLIEADRLVFSCMLIDIFGSGHGCLPSAGSFGMFHI